METLQQIIKRTIPENNLSIRQALESYDHIDLTEEETDAAILQAKQKKERLLKDIEVKMRIDESRRSMTSTEWDYVRTKNFMEYRAKELFKGKFILDESNHLIFDLLCKYFSNDKDFIDLATELGVENPSLHKGILLAGTFGTGKTWMMKLFQKNKKNCFLIKNSKEIAAEFQTDGQEAISNYTNKRKNSYNDAALFYQTFCGLCIDDMGTEETKNSFGNKSNVIGDILEMRYAKGDTGIYLHATTNMNAEGITNFYGGRIVSRMLEIFNIIELKGNDRRS